MEAAIGALITPLVLVAVMHERDSANGEATALYTQGLAIARDLHGHAHGWQGAGTQYGGQSEGTEWAKRALASAQRYQEVDPTAFKDNPRLMEMPDELLATIGGSLR